jgi:hypothetical protein
MTVARPLSLLLWLATTLICAAVSANEDAGASPYLSKRYFASAGLFFPDRELKFRVDGSASVAESNIDFSERFNFKGTDETGAFEIGWRFGEKWMFRGQYFNVENNSTATLTEDIVWGDYTFNAGTSVGAGSDVSIIRAFVGRTYRRQGNYEFGIGGGLHVLDIGASIRGNALVNGMDAGFRSESVSVRGPMPNIGAWYVRSLSPTLAVTVRTDWLSAKVGDYDGRIINAGVGMNYALTEHFGVGVNYNFFDLNIGVRDSGWKGRANVRYDGFYVFLSGYW